MSDLTDEQICKPVMDAHRGYGDPLDLKQLSKAAYALGREAGLKEAIAVCDKENVGLTGWRAELCAKAIRALIPAPPMDLTKPVPTKAGRASDREDAGL